MEIEYTAVLIPIGQKGQDAGRHVVKCPVVGYVKGEFNSLRATFLKGVSSVRILPPFNVKD